MAVTLVGTPNATVYTATSGAASGVGWSGSQPRTAGDLLVFIVTAAATTSVTTTSITAPAGWNTGVAVGNSSTAHAYAAIFWKIAAGGDAAPTTAATWSGTGRAGYSLFEFTGNEQILSPVDATGTEASGSTAASYTTITVTAGKALSFAGDYVISAFAYECATATAVSGFAAGTGFTNFSTDTLTSSRDHNAVDYATSTPAQGSTPSDAASATSNGTGYTAAALIAFAPPHDPVPLQKPVRAAIPPQPRLAGVYMGESPPPQNPLPAGTPWTPPAADTSFGTGQVQWNAGGPVQNPNIPGPSGPPLGWSSPVGVRAVIVRTGLAMATLIPSVTAPPAPTPAPFYPFTQAVRVRIPQNAPRGRTLGNKGAPVRNPTPGPVFFQATSPCRARIPRGPTVGCVTGYGSNGAICGAVNGNGFGSANGSKGAPVNNPTPGPVFFQRRTPVRFVLSPPPPRKGRVGSSFGAPVQNPIHGPPAYPLQGPVRVRLPQLQPRAGRVYSNAGAPVRNPVPGPVFVQRTSPAQARRPLPPRGRVYSSAPPKIITPSSGPVFAQANQALRARRPLQPFLRGRMASLWGAPVQNPEAGPAFTQATSPSRIRVTKPPRGRVYSNPGQKLLVHIGPVFFPADQVLRAKLPQQPFLRGRVTSNHGAPVHNPNPGPVFVQAVSPARARIPQTFSKGRVTSNPGAPIQNPVPGPVFRQATVPARIRVTLPRRGRIASNAGSVPVPVITGPVFTQKPYPARIRPTLPPRGRITFNAGAPVRNPVPGPVFRQAVQPAQARRPLPPRGRAAFNAGAPASAPATGPVFYHRNSPVRAQQPLPRRGLCRAIRFYPVQVNPPGPPPPVYPLQQPVRAPLPPLHPRAGRIGSNPGGPVSNPSAGPAFTSMSQPAGMRVIFLATGRAQSTKSYGAPAAPASGPVFTPADSPARARVPRNAPRGRVYANPGAPVRNATTGPAFRQAVHPAIARFPLPPRGRVYSNPGAPVHNPTAGPVFRPATAPIRARIPQRPLGGHCTSTPPSTVPVDITGLFEIVFPCAHLDAPASFPLPPPAVSLTGTIFPGEIGPFTPVLPHLKTSLTGTVLHQPLNLVLPLPVTSLSGQFNDARFNITLPPPVTGLSGKRVHTGTFAIVFNICSGMGGRYGLVITPPKPLKADFPESVDYATGIPYVTWAASDPYTSWITG